MIKKLFVSVFATSLASCANLGDGKFNPELSTDFKEVYTSVSPALKDVVTLVFFDDVTKIPKFLGKIDKAIQKAAAIEETYSAEEAVQKAKEFLLAECQVLCYLETIRPVVIEVGEYLDMVESRLVDTTEYRVVDVLMAVRSEVVNLPIVQAAEANV